LKAQSDFLKNTNHKLPFTEAVQFRTQTDEFDIRRHEYSVRMDFNTKAERKAQQNYHQQVIQLKESLGIQIIQEQLESKYIQWTNHHIYQKELDIRKDELKILEDRFRVIKFLVKSTDNKNIADLLRIQDDIDNISMGIFDLEKQVEILPNYISNNQQGIRQDQLDYANFISIKKVKELVDNWESGIPRNTEIEESRQESNLILAEMEQERAASKKLLDFAQVRYAGRGENTPYGREWSIGLGLNIPVKNSKHLDILELQLEQLEKEEEINNIQQEIQTEINEYLVELSILFDKYELLQQQLQESLETYSAEAYIKTGTDPLVVLQIKSSQLRKQRKLIEIEQDIYENYLELLFSSGKIIESPFVNYLSEELETF